MADTGRVEFIGTEKLSMRFQQLLASMGKQLMGEIGMFLMTRIKTRTAAGKDVEGSPFKPYSASYAFFRQKMGRPIDKVDLFFTGSMMGSMTYTETANSVRVFFAAGFAKSIGRFFGGGKSTSNPEKAYYLNQKRKFFSMSPQDQKDIVHLVLDSLGEANRR